MSMVMVKLMLWLIFQQAIDTLLIPMAQSLVIIQRGKPAMAMAQKLDF